MTPPEAAVPLDDVPVFPLPGVVFLPGQRLPLHIFEPRYRAMVRDALTGRPYLVVTRIEGPPAPEPVRFARVATVGKIVAHQRLADGRFNILLEGHARVALDELPFRPPYRRAAATLLAHLEADEVASSARAAMVSLGAQVVAATRARESKFEYAPPVELPSGRLALDLVDRLVSDPDERQAVLEAETVAARVRRSTEALAAALAALSPPSTSGGGRRGMA